MQERLEVTERQYLLLFLPYGPFCLMLVDDVVKTHGQLAFDLHVV